MTYERISQENLYEMNLADGTSPSFTFEDFDSETNEYINLTIHKTAQEVYDEWLDNKDKPSEPTDSDKISILEEEILMILEQNVDLEYRLLILEFNKI